MTIDAQTQVDPDYSGTELVAQVPWINIQAFCDTEATAQTIQLAAADRRMLRTNTIVYPGSIQGACRAFESQPSPNLLIVESRGDQERIISELASLSEVCQPDTKVIVIGHVNDVLLYRALIRQGISEYLVAPLNQVQLIEIIASLYQNPKAAPLGRVLAFIGAKGGVGSSTLAQSVAWTISKSHAMETVIADMDIAFGTAGLNFNQDVPGGIIDILGQPDRMDTTLVERLLTKVGDRLSLLSGPGGVESDFHIEPAAIDSILSAMRVSMPCIILDLPTLWAPWVKFALLNSDQVIITTTPELAGLRNTKSIADLLKASRPNDPPPKLVVNQVGVPKRPDISLADFGKAVDIPISASIPFDAKNFGIAQNNGKAIFEVAPKSKAAIAIAAFGKQLLPAEKPEKKTAGGGSLLGRILGKK